MQENDTNSSPDMSKVVESIQPMAVRGSGLSEV